VAAVAEAMGKDIEPIHSTGQGGGVRRMCADLARSRKLLGFEPKIGLAEGLRLMLERDPRFQGVAS
jgi:UDP-glucose 4-epimerase